MNIFILNTGRCGSTTFIKACQHITNFSAAHESLASQAGFKRLAYPDQHIEADNRLSWFLGRLDEKYSNDAFYVHLKRTKKNTVDSFSRRENFGIMKAYKEGILLGYDNKLPADEIAADYIHTVESNIQLFLKDKTKKIEFTLENAGKDFKIFWEKISAEGNLSKALKEWNINYNKSSD
jgi:hypothetical protein